MFIENPNLTQKCIVITLIDIWSNKLIVLNELKIQF
jgi:hypothetical protein